MTNRLSGTFVDDEGGGVLGVDEKKALSDDVTNWFSSDSIW